MPKKKNKMKFSDEVLNFKCNLAEFKEDENSKGKFKGLLVNMQGDNTAKGIYRFKTGSMKKNDGKKKGFLYKKAWGLNRLNQTTEYLKMKEIVFNFIKNK